MSEETRRVYQFNNGRFDLVDEPINPTPEPVVNPIPEPAPEPVPEPVVNKEPIVNDPEPEPIVPEPVPEPDPIPEPEPEPFVTDDFYKASSLSLKEIGDLPEDFELEDGLSGEQASEKIFNAFYDNYKKSAQELYFQEFQENMKKKGWTERTLEYAYMLENGVSDEIVSDIVDFSNLSRLDTKSLEHEDKVDYITMMYKDRNFSEKEIKRNLNDAEVEGDIDSIVEEAKSYFSSRASEEQKKALQLAQERERQVEAAARYNQAVVSSIFTTKKIGNEDLSDDQLDTLQKALYERNIPLQGENGIVNVSAFDRFKMQFDNDLAVQIYVFNQLLSKSNEKEVQKERPKIKWGKSSHEIKTKTEPEPTPIQQIVKKSGGSTKSYLVEDGKIIPIDTD